MWWAGTVCLDAPTNWSDRMNQKNGTWKNRAFVFGFLVLTLFCWCPLGYGSYGPVSRILGIPYWAVVALAVGAALFVLLLSVFGIRGLVATISVCGIAAGFCLGAGASVRLGWTAVVCIGAAAVSLVTMPHGPPPSPHKALSVLTEMPGTTTLAQARGPMGRVDAVAGPHVHVAPGLSLQYTDPLPPHVLLMHDGDQGGAVYRCVRREQWGFLDYTTAAAPYHLVPAPSVCVLGAGGGADIGLARYHGARRIVAVEANPSVVQLMTGPLAARSGDIYQAQGVVLRNADARGYLTTTGETFDIIQLPPIDSFGAAGSGMGASQESHLYTVEAVELMLTRLSPGGILCLTRWLRTPPRDGLRLVNVVAEAQRRLQLEPRKHLVALRNWVTLTVLASAAPFDAERLSRLKTFCERRGFDRCHEPGLAVEETNRFHVLTGPLYFEGIRELLGDDRERFVDDYLFDLSASTDDKPYFHHFFRWRALPAMRRELGGQSPAFVELSTAMLATCLAQSLLMAGVLFLVPLAVRRVVTRRRRPSSQSHAERATTRFACVYFALIGAGYMLLEMGFLHRFTRYLAHPVYAAATVIAAFLLFSGAGSFLSGRRGAETLVRTAATAGMVVAVVGAAYAFGLDRWLAFTQGSPLPARAMVAALTVAPLAGAMGYLFPSGLRILQSHRGGYVPLAWGINGFASVAATIATPLIAMEIGFQRLTLIAAGLYAAAAITCLLVKGMGTDRGENQSD